MKLDILYNDVTEHDLETEMSQMVEKVIRRTLESENISFNTQVSVSFVDNNEIRNINKKFRRIDAYTDVLSFPLIDFEDENIFEEDIFYEIGDIIISYEKAMEQAKSYNHSIERELAFLIAHSVLHLLGYDHMSKEEENLMFAKQKDILNSLDIIR